MKTIIICSSVHTGSTKRIAYAMAEVIPAVVCTPAEIEIDKLSGYELIGFGSGIFNFKHHSSLLKLVKDLCDENEKKAFIFSTRGVFPVAWCHRVLKIILSKKGYIIIGEYSCKGYVNFGPAKPFGGINKNKPDSEDIQRAKEFVLKLLKDK